jgi:hypothetical protein
LAPTTAGRTLDVSAGGEAGIDWANVGSPMTVVNLAGTQINEVNQGVDVNRLDASFTSLDNLVDFVDFGYDAATNKVNGVVLVDTATNLTNAATVGDLTAAMIASVTAAVPTSTTITNAVAAQIITDHGSGPYTQNTEPLTASQTRDALGMTSANLDSQLGTLATGANLATTDGKIDAIKTKADYLPSATAGTASGVAIVGSEMTLADSEDVYPADIGFTIDDTNARDEYTVQWFRNGTPVTSGVTVPTIQAIKRANGTDLIPTSVMTQIGSTGAYKYDASTTERTTAGEAVVVVASATINGATRTWRKVITRDVETA